MGSIFSRCKDKSDDNISEDTLIQKNQKLKEPMAIRNINNNKQSLQSTHPEKLSFSQYANYKYYLWVICQNNCLLSFQKAIDLKDNNMLLQSLIQSIEQQIKSQNPQYANYTIPFYTQKWILINEELGKKQIKYFWDLFPIYFNLDNAILQNQQQVQQQQPDQKQLKKLGSGSKAENQSQNTIDSMKIQSQQSEQLQQQGDQNSHQINKIVSNQSQSNQNTTVIHIYTTKGQDIQFFINPFRNVLYLKKNLQQQKKYPIERQEIILHGKRLQDDYNLSQIQNISEVKFLLFIKPSNDIQNEIFANVKDTILQETFFQHFQAIQQGDAKAAQLLSRAFLEIRYENKGFICRNIKQGLNIEARCTNKNCEIFGKCFIRSIDSGIFDFELDEIECKCQKRYKGELCGLLRCTFKWSGVYIEKNNDNYSTNIFNEQICQTVGDQYYLCSKARYNGANSWFGNLKIVVEKKKWDQFKDGTQMHYCGICLNYVIDSQNQIQLKCQHLYHKNCWDSFVPLLNQNKNIQCILCNQAM